MSRMGFQHLHLHTDFSVLDGLGKIKDYVAEAKKNEFKALAITDHGNIDGARTFQKECLKNNITPIIGCEMYIVPDLRVKEQGEKRFHATVLVKNEQGWKNILYLLSIANIEGFYYRPRIDFKLFEENSEGLILMTACSASFLNSSEGLEFFNRMKNKNPEDLYLEVMPHQIPEQKFLNLRIRDLKKKNPEIKLVATNDCHYVCEEDSKTHEVLLAMQSNSTIYDEKRFKFPTDGFYLKTEEEMEESFRQQKILKKEEITEALRTPFEIYEKCKNFQIKDIPIQLPDCRIDKSISEAQNLQKIIFKCYSEKYKEPFLKNKKWYQRIMTEYNVIKEKGFCNYFLLVYDLVNWAISQGIKVGLGRGSVGGSLMAFILGITAVDSLKYGLIFERFLNPERNDFPDIDLDFPDDKRDEIIAYLKRKYGEDCVAGVSAYGTMQARETVRGVARALAIPLKEADFFAKTIDSTSKTGLQTALSSPDGQLMEKKYPSFTSYCLKLEGTIKSKGQHASAFIVNNQSLYTSGQCNLVKRKESVLVNWDKEDCEDLGLMKLDLLGLRQLRIFKETENYIKETTGKKLNIRYKEPVEEEIFEMIDQGFCSGIFQMNTSPFKNLISRMGLSNFEEMSSMQALVRPGPSESGVTAKFIDRKHGEKYEPISPEYDEITKETYGLVVYQEQVMFSMVKLAGMKFSQADKVRKIIGKKRDVSEFEQFKEEFVNGCVEHRTLTKDQAEHLWGEFEEHSKYSFNKSHSVAYALISYLSGWYKKNYPLEYFAGCLTAGQDDKKEELVKEFFNFGFHLITPKIGISKATKWVIKDGKLYAPFSEIEGIGPKNAEKAEAMEIQTKKGFKPVAKKPKYVQVLEEAGCFEKGVSSGVQKFFSFPISNDVSVVYPKLSLYYEDRSRPVNEYATGKIKPDVQVIKEVNRDFYLNIPEEINLQCCEKCLKQENLMNVHKGKYNILVINETPDAEDLNYGTYYNGQSGTILINALWKYGIDIKDFFISSFVNCSLGFKRPDERIKKYCSAVCDFNIREIRPKIIFAFGNYAMEFFKQEKAGIVRNVGTVEWNDNYNCWICYGLQPFMISFLGEENHGEEKFEKGIDSFVKLIENLSTKEIFEKITQG